MKSSKLTITGKNKRLTKELADAQALNVLQEGQANILKHTVAELEKRLAKAEQECEEYKTERNQIQQKLSSAAEVQQAVQRELDSCQGRI